MIDEATFNEWKNNECTKQFVDLLMAARNACAEANAKGSFLGAPHPLSHAAAVVGSIDTYDRAIMTSINYEAFKDAQEGVLPND